MPLITVRIDQTLYSDILTLVAGRDYRDFQQVVEVALLNHLQLEQQHGLATERGPETPKTSKSVTTQQSQVTRVGTSVAESTQPEMIGARKPESDWKTVAAAFRFTSDKTNTLAPCPTTARPNDEHLYALVNRLFPLKLVTRWLDTHANAAGHWPAASNAVAAFGRDAEIFGSALARRDRAQSRGRDQQLATSLPRTENPKSKDRFTTQFVARVTDAGEIYPGGVIQFALASVKNGQLMLTEAGQALSRLDNELIDGDQEDVSDPLSAEERTILVSQMRSYMPAEAAHMAAVLKAVANGAKSPEQIMTGFIGRFSGLTDSAVRSHLSGIVARAIDLKLLHRDWAGRYAFYTVTNEGFTILGDNPEHVLPDTTSSHTPANPL